MEGSLVTHLVYKTVLLEVQVCLESFHLHGGGVGRRRLRGRQRGGAGNCLRDIGHRRVILRRLDSFRKADDLVLHDLKHTSNIFELYYSKSSDNVISVKTAAITSNKRPFPLPGEYNVRFRHQDFIPCPRAGKMNYLTLLVRSKL